MPKDFTKTKKGETVPYWRSQLERAKKVWDVKEDIREQLRRYTSEYELDQLLFTEDDGDDAPIIDNVDYYILPRFVDRIKQVGGDEKPEVRIPRDLVGMDPETKREVSLAKVGEIQDRLVMLAMAQAGAPEEYEDGLGAICVDGITAFWWERTGLPSVEDEIEARKSVGEIGADAARGIHEPNRLQDHTEVGPALMQAAASDPEAAEQQFATTAEGESPIERVAAAGAEHIAAAEREEKGYPFNWRDGKFRLKCTRLPYGEWFRMDSTVTKHRDVRWMSRLHAFDLEEARNHPAFRPSVRAKLTTEPFAHDEKNNRGLSPIMPEAVGGDADAVEAANGRVLVWQILDKKYGREYWLPAGEGLNEFLADRPAPMMDANGRSVLESVGAYQGFFPVALGWAKKPTRDCPQKLLCVPLAQPGLKGQRTVIEQLSYYNRSLRQASASYNFVDEDVFEEHKDDFEENDGGVFPITTGRDAREMFSSGGWRPPPAELYQGINDTIMRTLNDLDFPIAEFTSRPIAKTATQETMAQESGSRSAIDNVRHMEVSYAISAHIVLSVIKAGFTDAEIDSLVGPVDGARLRAVWRVVGNPVELPEVDFAPKSRNKNLGRSKLLLDLHERAKAELDPLTGAPLLDTTHLLHEAYKSAGLGPPPKYEMSEEDRMRLAVARVRAKAQEQAEAEKAAGQAAGNGKTRDSQGKPRGRRENAGRRDSSRGRARGERVGADLGAAARGSRSQ